jgi:hypothetical protein
VKIVALGVSSPWARTLELDFAMTNYFAGNKVGGEMEPTLHQRPADVAIVSNFDWQCFSYVVAALLRYQTVIDWRSQQTLEVQSFIMAIDN